MSIDYNDGWRIPDLDGEILDGTSSSPVTELSLNREDI